jgi:hypothetical protein
LKSVGGCLSTWKYGEDEILTGEITGEEIPNWMSRVEWRENVADPYPGLSKYA